jgi:predicted dehydrogenase
MNSLDRRSFLKSTAGTLALLLSREGLSAAQTISAPPPAGPPLRVGLIGLGPWGREILDAIGRTDAAQAAAICDPYEPFLKRAVAAAPRAAAVTDWRRLLDSAEVDAIVIATPTPAHREIAVAALQAGKHVYCEAPIAASIEDVRAIAAAAAGAKNAVFQGGLQGRSNALYRHVLQFVKSGVLGDVAAVHAQWNRKDSWRRAAPTPERERELNWRLDKASPGLMGEVGIHQIDLISQYLGAAPAVVNGSGTIAAWRDGRGTPDTAACVLRFGRHRAEVRATLASSFGGAYTVFQGTNSSLLLKESRGWLIKEADSPLLGWEVYARKESVHDETGIALVADATKLLQAGKEPGKDGPVEPEKPALVLALEAFVVSVRTGAPSPCGPSEACAATEAALAANAAVLSNSDKEMAHDR